MPRHRGTRRSRSAGSRRLLLGYADLLILCFCCLGILGAWLIYGAASAGHSTAGKGPPARYSPVAPVAQFPPGLIPPPQFPPGLIRAGLIPTGPQQAAGLIPIGPQQAAGLQPGRAGAGTAMPAADKPAPAKTAPAKTQAAKTTAAKAAPKPVRVTAAPPQRVIYPAAGIDVVVHHLKPDSDATASRSIVPPETLDGYWLAPYGMPGAGSVNTTYVIGHSWEGRDAPFNHLSSSAAPGDVFTVLTSKAELLYRVDTVTTYTKSSLKDSTIWAVVPNRLVLISCYTGDLWGKNVALVASPVKGK
jgi:Sortase domain